MKAVARPALVLFALMLCPALFGVPPGLTIDYPSDASLFPPDIAAPTFLWRDESPATAWRISIQFTGAAPLSYLSDGPRVRLGPIDQDCISTTNRLPTVDPRQRSWKPGTSTWALIKTRSQSAPATITFTGLAAGAAVSKASIHIQTSTHPVGAPIFYRDVPLMPSETEPGIIKPLAPYAVRLVQWRVRDISQDQSRIVMRGLPVCANCHSFSTNGQFMGMDLDGLQNNKGRYFLTPIKPETNVRREDVIQWSSAEGRLQNAIRVGFMSQISPAGDKVITTIDTPGATNSNYYVANFTDYRFLQVFFPVRGILAWFSRQTGILQPLPGADDPAFVQFGAVWSPDSESLVYARAPARDPNPPGLVPAKVSNDPNELQIRYDLYRIPFRNGQGGKAEPIAGASANGMSNSFPKLSPDGRWLVYVQSRNGQLMRPDSQLYIVPAQGGTPRRMRCNTPRMNSWHSFSPNSRWMVFSSKARSPYTQMYLTHIDDDGNDSPPILIENSTAANRAVNLPEFVNVADGGFQSLGGPALDYYRLYDRALYLEKQKRFDESAAQWKALLDIAPEDVEARRRLGMTLLLAGRRTEAAPLLKQQQPKTPLAHAIELLESNQDAGPLTVSANPSADEHYYLALLNLRRADRAQALAHLRETIRLHPNNANALRRAAWLLATDEQLRKGDEALTLARRALLLTNPADPDTLDTLAAAYAASNRFADAITATHRAIAADPSRTSLLQRRLQRYQASQSWTE
jgi:tetratricopeptide (TPR) repeat protein